MICFYYYTIPGGLSLRSVVAGQPVSGPVPSSLREWMGSVMSAPSRARNLFVALLLLGVTAVWGWTFVIVKDAIAQYGVYSFLSIRFGLAALVMVPFARRLSRESWRAGLGIGVVLGVAYILQTLGLQSTTATNSGLITGLFVIFAPLWNRALYGVRTHAVTWMQVGVSLLGLSLLTGGVGASFVVGDLLTLGCAIAFGLHIALLDRHSKDHDSGSLAFVQLCAATALFLIAWPFSDPLVLPPGPSVWGAIVLCGVIATAVGFTAQTLAQRTLPAVRTALILSMEPVWAAVFGRMLAGDELGPVQVLGAVLMVGAAATASVYQPGRRKARGDRGEKRASAE